MPTLPQLDEVFALLPDEPKGPVQRVGPQYRKPPTQRSGNVEQPSWLRGQWNKLFKPSTAANTGNAGVNTLRNGDRALIVAVNDSGNTGWVRFGRSGFEAVPMV
jgi:tRNA-splicing endonuclease subunit Sen54